jgi:hypothetical protein
MSDHYLEATANAPAVYDAARRATAAAWDHTDPSPDNVVASLIVAMMSVLRRSTGR